MDSELNLFLEANLAGQDYYTQIQASSFMRVYKLLASKQRFYDGLRKRVQSHCDELVRKAYEIKSNSVALLKGSKSIQLPIDLYLSGYE